MTRLFRTTALATLFAASPALADLSVDDAWGVWKAQFQAYGLTLEAAESRDGDALQIGDVALLVNFPDNSGSARLTFTGPRFEPLGDGTVRIAFPANVEARMSGEVKGEGSFSARIGIEGDSANAVMSGTPEAAVTNWDGQGFDVILREVSVDGSPADDVKGGFKMGPYTMRSATEISGDHVTISQKASYSAYSVDYAIGYRAGETASLVSADGYANNVEVDSVSILPRAGLDPLGLHTQLRDGLDLRARVTASDYGSTQKTELDGQPFSSQYTRAEAYDVSIAFDQRGLEYTGTTGAFEGGGMLPGMPLPIALAGKEVDFRLLLPVLKSDAMQPAALKLALGGVTMEESLWSLFDPTTQLPHDPMTIAVDLAAETSLLFDFLDIRALMIGKEPTGLPVTADRVTLNNLTVSAVGAELTGTGDFALDYTDMSTFDGMPAPDGQATFTLKGSNALIDKLIAMGLVSTDDAMGARMMMSMFAKPGEGDDVLISEIEVRKTGEVTANGQRIR